MINNKFKIDIIINIIANAVPIAVMQIMILPLLASSMTSTDYGLILTSISLFTIISGTLGNILNNVKLLTFKEYKFKKLNDLQILFIISEFANGIFLLVSIYIFCRESSFLHIIFSVILGFLWLGREYHVVIYRIKLKYIGFY